MSNTKAATPREMIWIGALFAAIGLYFMLVGVSVLPVPGGPRNLHAPLWIVVCAGLTFFLGGAAVLLQGFGRANASGELPADAPAWMGVAQHLIGAAIFAAFALIGSWIALAGESRQFSGSLTGLGIGVSIARMAFGLGALICWACTIGMIVSAARKLTGARKST